MPQTLPELNAWFHQHGFSESYLDQRNSSGLTPLLLACQQGYGVMVAYLLSQGVALDAVDAYGNNALWAACYSEDSGCITLLLEAGIDLNYQNQAAGATVLIYAASSGKEAVVRQLLDAGADAGLKTHDDFTALDLASTINILKLLKQKS